MISPIKKMGGGEGHFAKPKEFTLHVEIVLRSRLNAISVFDLLTALRTDGQRVTTDTAPLSSRGPPGGNYCMSNFQVVTRPKILNCTILSN